MQDPLISAVIATLEAQKREFALDALLRPPREGDHAFLFGLASGKVQGLETALAVIRDILTEIEKDERNG